MLTLNTPFAVYYEKIRNHLGKTATNGAKIHSFARKNGRLPINQIQLRFLHFHQHSITFWGVIRHTKEKNIFSLTPTDNRSKSNQSSERCSQSYFTDKLQREREGEGGGEAEVDYYRPDKCQIPSLHSGNFLGSAHDSCHISSFRNVFETR